MTHIECPGLDGSNPQHFMASLGVLRLLHRQNVETRMTWTFACGTYRPVFARPQTDWSMEALGEELFAWVAELGKTQQPRKDLQRQANELAKTIKDQDKALAVDIRAMKTAARGQPKAELQATIASTFGQRQAELANNRKTLAELQIQIGDALGQGIAHLGPIIGVNPDLFRAKAIASLERWLNETPPENPNTDDPSLVTATLAGLACDQMSEGNKLVYTPYSFSNGGGGQCLLKDFRNCAINTRLPHLLGTLRGKPHNVTTVGSLGWDPSDQAHYAMQWAAPKDANKKGTKKVDPAVQALAYIGLSMLTAVPQTKLTAIGWHRIDGHKGICWPIWDAALTLDTVQALLAMDLTQAGPTTGITTRFHCAVQNPNGKRNFFSPSRSV
jgi:hypothetical protein